MMTNILILLKTGNSLCYEQSGSVGKVTCIYGLDSNIAP